MTCQAVTHKISERRYAYFPCHVNKSNIRNTPLEQQLKKKIVRLISLLLVEKTKKWKIMVIAKLFALHANAIFLIFISVDLVTT